MEMQRCGDEAMECPGEDHLGQSKKERPQQNDSKMRRKESRCSGLDHLGWNKQQEPPPPGLDHPSCIRAYAYNHLRQRSRDRSRRIIKN